MAYNVEKILERKKIINVIIMCDIIHVICATNFILACVCVCVCVNHVTKEEENQILTSSTYNK